MQIRKKWYRLVYPNISVICYFVPITWNYKKKKTNLLVISFWFINIINVKINTFVLYIIYMN